MVSGWRITCDTVSKPEFLCLDSPLSEYIGAGKGIQILEPKDFQFTGHKIGNSPTGVQVELTGDQSWVLILLAPFGQALKPGLYNGATYGSAHQAFEPSLQVYGANRGCTTYTGSFEILSIVTSNQGVTFVSAKFSQQCDGGLTLLGKVVFNSSYSVPFVVDKIHHLSIRGCGTNPTSKWFCYNSEAGDFVGLGTNHLFSGTGVTATLSIDKMNIQVNAVDGSQNWILQLSSPLPIEKGLYSNATRYPYNSPIKPGMDNSGNNRECNQLLGSFEILNIQYKGNFLACLTATFVQKCDFSSSALYGKVNYDSGIMPCTGTTPVSLIPSQIPPTPARAPTHGVPRSTVNIVLIIVPLGIALILIIAVIAIVIIKRRLNHNKFSSSFVDQEEEVVEEYPSNAPGITYVMMTPMAPQSLPIQGTLSPQPPVYTLHPPPY